VRISRRIVIIFNNVAAYYWTMTLTPVLADERIFCSDVIEKENDHTSQGVVLSRQRERTYIRRELDNGRKRLGHALDIA
jgi:hypothetical protein